MLHHTHDQIQLLKELKRTCRKIIIIENTPETQIDWYFAKKHSQSEWGSCEKCFKNVQEWINIFENIGFKVATHDPISRWLCPFSDKPFWYPIKSCVFVLT